MIAITKTKCDQIRCIADHFGTSHVLRRAGEEFSVEPDLQRLVTVQVAHKVNRTLKRYDIKVPAGGAGRDAAKEID